MLLLLKRFIITEDMFPFTVRVWNGLTKVTPCIATQILKGHFLLASTIWRSNRAVDFVRFYQEVHLNEDEMEENFIKGWGKGGQKVNKSSNCVQLKHKPTGIIVKCHESRSLARNRVIARELLKQKLDFLFNGKESELVQTIAKTKKKKADYARKRRRREEAVAAGLQNVDNGPADAADS